MAGTVNTHPLCAAPPQAVEWSLNMMTTGAQRLREMERTAKQARRGIWVGYVPQNTGQTKLSDTYTGKVVEVVSGDCFIIKDAAAGVERRVTLARCVQSLPRLERRRSAGVFPVAIASDARAGWSDGTQ